MTYAVEVIRSYKEENMSGYSTCYRIPLDGINNIENAVDCAKRIKRTLKENYDVRILEIKTEVYYGILY